MVAIYLRDLMEDPNSASVLDSTFYGIQWAHNLAGCVLPTTHPVVKCTLEAAKRKVARPVSPKEPLSLSLIQFLSLHYNKVDASLNDIRFLFILLVGYSGFTRIEEIISVRVMDLQFHSDHMTIFVPKRKMTNTGTVIQLTLRCLVRSLGQHR